MNTPRRRGRPPVLTLDDVAQAVLEVGFVDLTFAAVRERLRVGESTIYRYAQDRNTLVRLGMDRALADANWPERSGPWRTVLSEHALTVWELLAQHPGAALEAGRGVVPDRMMTLFADLVAYLVGNGFSADDAVLACDLVMDLVTDHRQGIENRGTQSFVLPRNQPGDDVARAIGDALNGDPSRWFQRKLAVVLDGIESSLAS